MRRLACFATLLLAVLAPARAGEGADIAQVKPADCPNCRSSGAVACPACSGVGRNFKAQIDCSHCKGKGTVPCNRCDAAGEVICPDCSRRKLDGKDVNAAINPQWTTWDEERKKPAKKGEKKNTSPEPAKYIPCPKCSAKGRMKCPACEGTKKSKCSKPCGGTGKTTGLGTCPTCAGSKKGPCPQCASIEGMTEIPGFTELEELRAQKTLKEEEYFAQRRMLVAQEKRRREIAAAKEKEEVKAQEKSAPATAAESPTPAFDAAAQKKTLAALAKLFGAGSVPYAMYEEKSRALGLTEQEVREVEESAAAESPRLKSLMEAKALFRDGTLDFDEFKAKVKSL